MGGPVQGACGGMRAVVADRDAVHKNQDTLGLGLVYIGVRRAFTDGRLAGHRRARSYRRQCSSVRSSTKVNDGFLLLVASVVHRVRRRVSLKRSRLMESRSASLQTILLQECGDHYSRPAGGFLFCYCFWLLSSEHGHNRRRERPPL